MKSLKYGFGLAVVAGFSLMAACGGSSSSDSVSTAGDSSGGNGSTTAGASSTTTAGAFSTAAGATSTPGGADSGGADSVAGSSAAGGALAAGGASAEGGATSTSKGGAAGAGGAGMTNPADCPATAPTDAAVCTPLASNQERCTYGTASCRCSAMGGGMMQGTAGGGAATTSPTWRCGAACPAVEPTVGDDCTQSGACQYGMGACTCGQTKKWTCFGGMMGAGGAGGAAGGSATCPVAKPTAGGACTATTRPCTYSGSRCFCQQEKWLCN